MLSFFSVLRLLLVETLMVALLLLELLGVVFLLDTLLLLLLLFTVELLGFVIVKTLGDSGLGCGSTNRWIK